MIYRIDIHLQNKAPFQLQHTSINSRPCTKWFQGFAEMSVLKTKAIFWVCYVNFRKQ